MIKRNGDNVFAIASSDQCQGARGTVSLCPGGGGGGGGGAATRIPRATAVSAVRMTPPDAQLNTKEANIALSTYVEKWKNRYEDAERKHKACLLKSEKAKREYDDLQRRYNILQEERNHLDGSLLERERELSKLRNVSEKLFQEYQQLKNQHEVDAGVMHKVMAQAGEWYKQNKQLKRRSTALLQALPARAVDIDFTDSTDTASDTSSNEEVEFLKSTVSELSGQVASLQTELSQAKLHEFEAHEANVALAQDLETCQATCSSQETELSELRSQLERHNRVSKLLVEEVTALKDNADKDREMCETYKTEARAAKKRVKVLTHQSALLSGELDAEERLALLLRELDELRAALEDQAQRHRDQLEDLQLKLAEKHEDTDILVWEEKIKLAEEDARKALERAERAERKLTDSERKLTEIGGKLTDSEKQLTEIGARLTNTESKLTSTESKLTSTETKLTSTETKLTSTESRLTLTENKLSECNGRPKKSSLMSRISYFENGASVKEEKKIESVEEKKVESVEEKKIDPVEEEKIEVVAAPSSDLERPERTPSPQPTLEPEPPTAPTLPPTPPPPPPMAPPPPPPPPPPPVFNPTGEDMTSMLANKQGTLRRTSKQHENGGGAIDAIVDQIKGGKFQLKSRENNFMEKKPKEEQPEAVKEMLAILGTLRKRRPQRPTIDYTDF